ncbi:MAG: cytochrome P450 [Actinobacteria bacterium]|nr:cytochrome P450 [Actinomycetota bacterium]
MNRSTTSLDLLAADVVADPHAPLGALRDEHPLWWNERHRAWMVLGHPELVDAFGDTRLSTERMSGFLDRLPAERRDAVAAGVELLDGWMLFHEPPDHERLRAPLRREFTPRAVGAMEQWIAEECDRLLDRLEAGPDQVDLVEAFTHPLPSAVIGRLVGVPEEMGSWLAGWSERFGVLVFGATRRDDYDQVVRSCSEEFHDVVGDLLRRRAGEPGEDLLSKLLGTEDRADGLSPVEILGACSLLLFAGHDTTTSLLGSAVTLLDGAPEWRDGLVDAPDRIDGVVEECLRMEGPAKHMVRQVAEDHERCGVQLRAGESVLMGIMAADRDPRVFDDPDRFDGSRSPNAHLGFGFGHHFCLGAALGRLEARLALAGLYRRFPDLSVCGEVTWKPTVSDRSPVQVPVQLR